MTLVNDIHMPVRTKHPPKKQIAPTSKPEPPLGRELLDRLYAAMLQCRIVEERVQRLFRRSESVVGQEAVYVGTTLQLRPDDTLAPSQHDLFAQIVKGTPLRFLFAQRFAAQDFGLPDAASHCGYAPPNVITPASVAGANIQIAAGIALAAKLNKKDSVVLALCGNASQHAAWAEALKFAGRLKLPMLFVVERAASSKGGAQNGDAGELAHRAGAHGVPIIPVDANDAVAVYRVAHEAIHYARIGRGATVIDCVTTPASVAAGRPRDPLELLERYMRRYEVWSDQRREQIIAHIESDIEEAVKIARQAPFLEPEQVLDGELQS